MCLSLSQQWWWERDGGLWLTVYRLRQERSSWMGSFSSKSLLNTTHVCVPSKQLFKDKELVPLSLQLLSLVLFLTCHRGSSVNDQCMNEWVPPRTNHPRASSQLHSITWNPTVWDRSPPLGPRVNEKEEECMCAKSLSHVQFFVTPWTVACQAPLSMEFSRQECWSWLSFPFPGDLPDPGIEPASLMSPALAGEFFYNRCHLENPSVTVSGIN